MNTPPFGYAIVDKDETIWDFAISRKLAEEILTYYEARDPKSNYRIVELYTKEQLDKACEESTEAIRSAARRIGKSTFTANLIAHGIVRSSSDEKGDV